MKTTSKMKMTSKMKTTSKKKTTSKMKTTLRMKTTSKTPNPPKPHAFMRTICTMLDFRRRWIYSPLRYSLTQNFFGSTNIWNSTFFWAKNSYGHKIFRSKFFAPGFFILHFLDPELFWTQNILSLSCWIIYLA